MKKSARPIVVALIVALLASPVLSQDPVDDLAMRRDIAARIAQSHQVTLDWRNTSLLDLMDAEARLNTVERVRSTYGVSVDWRKSTLLELMDMEARMGAAKRISLAVEIPVDWKKFSLKELTEMEARISRIDVEALKKAIVAPTSRSNSDAGPRPLPSMQKVDYISDSILRTDGKIIKLLGGSSWVLESRTFALVMDEVVIVFKQVELKDSRTVQIAVAYIDGQEIIARHAGGPYVTESGYLTTVVQEMGDGAVLKLAGGTVLEVPRYDRYHTRWWLPPYNALLTRDKFYLWNLAKGKRVLVRAK